MKAGDLDAPNPSSLRPNGQTNGRPHRQLRFDDEDDIPHERGRAPIFVHSDDVQDAAGIEAFTDGMGAIVFTDEEDCGFFGNYRRLIPESFETSWTDFLVQGRHRI